jgi:diguanylate cyclase (GGDEF)-like protein
VEHDSLTGLLNRRGFERALALQISAGHRYGEKGSLLLVDLDGFKIVNDTIGHAGGDQVIVNASGTLIGRLRDTDVIGRLGGDEFAVILPEQDLREAEEVAQDLVAQINRNAARLSSAVPAVTASIGVMSLSDSSVTPDEAMVRADRAMYEAKRGGKNCVAVYGTGVVTNT